MPPGRTLFCMLGPLDPVARARRDRLRIAGAAGVSGIASVAALVVAAFAAGSLERGSVIALFAVLAPLFALTALPMMRNALADRAPSVVMMGTLGVTPALFLLALLSLAQPIAEGGFRCGTGEVGVVCVLPAVVAIVATVTGGGAWMSNRARRVLPIAACVAAVVASLLVAAGLLRSLERPAPDAWAASRPLVAELSYDPHLERATNRIADDLAIERECADGYCTVTLRHVAIPGPVGEDITARVPPCVRQDSLEAPQILPLASERCGRGHPSFVGTAIRVRADRSRELWLVESDTKVLGFGADLDPRFVNPRELAGELAPPRTFLGLGLAGLVVALLALLRRAQLALRSRVIARGRACVVDEHGVAFDDGELPARGVASRAVELGPAVAIEGRTGNASYRDDGSRASFSIVPGEKAELLRALRARRATCDATALTVLVLTSTPLFAAALQQMLF